MSFAALPQAAAVRDTINPLPLERYGMVWCILVREFMRGSEVSCLGLRTLDGCPMPDVVMLALHRPHLERPR